jgi:hypothetical protein
VVGGLIDIIGNTVLARNTSTTTSIILENRNSSLTGHRVRISRNHFFSLGAAGLKNVQVLVNDLSGTPGSAWENVEFSSNYSNNLTRFTVSRKGSSVDVAATDVVVRDNVLVGSYDRAVIVEGVTRCAVTNNVIRGCLNTGIWISAASFTSATNAELVEVSGNTLISCVTNAPTSATSLDTDITVTGATAAVIKGNSHYSTNATKPRAYVLANVTNLYIGEYAAMYAPRVLPVDLTVTSFASATILFGSATYNPPSLNDGDGATTTLTVTGAALGDYVESVSFSLDLQGITLTGYVSASNTVSVRFQNETGSIIDLASGTLRACVRKV